MDQMRHRTVKNIFKLFLIIFILGALIYGAGLINLKKTASQSASDIKKELKSAVSSLKNFDTEGAKKSFWDIYNELIGLEHQTQKLSLDLFIKDLPKTFNNLGELSLASIDLTTDIELLKNNGFNWLLTQKGDLLIEQLKEILKNIRKISPLINQIKQQATAINYPLTNDFNEVTGQLFQGEQILGALINWLSSSDVKNILVLFQNHSEIRPGGGFLGSFAHVILKRGSLVNLEVRDIYDIDGQLQKKIIPPKALQTITAGWGARDANWFFDFPTSARKVSQLLGSSKFYQEKNTRFDGALAINAKIITDILEIVGPIDLPDYQLTVDAENFLSSIQREVEEGADNKAGRPKKILTVLMPVLIERLGKLSDEQKYQLAQKLAYRFQNKDIMVYFEDLIIESYLKELAVAGEIISLPKDFNGDYLAIVNANVAGGKTDILIKQKISLRSDVNLQGILTNNLEIKRQRMNTEEKDWWYKSPNQVFMQIIVSPGAFLKYIQGGEEKSLTPMLDYEKQGYETDNDLEAAQLVNAFDRQNFSTWLTTNPDETKIVAAGYENDKAIRFDKPFIFIFEKQSGVDSEFEYAIAAPVGYKWKESDSPVFKYTKENTPARIILELNLEKE